MSMDQQGPQLGTANSKAEVGSIRELASERKAARRADARRQGFVQRPAQLQPFPPSTTPKDPRTSTRPVTTRSGSTSIRASTAEPPTNPAVTVTPATPRIESGGHGNVAARQAFFELPGSPHTSAIIRERRKSTGTPGIEPVEVQRESPAAGTPSADTVFERLSSIRWGSTAALRIEEPVTFRGEAEARFRNFINTLRTVTADRARPDRDPLQHIEGCWCGIDRITIQGLGSNAKKQNYIRFKGVENEEDVKVLHAVLSKKKFRKEYHPLHICYSLQGITPCASGTKLLRRATSSLFTFYRPASIDSMKSALVDHNPSEKPRLHSLCGTLMSIGTGSNRRTVTIGGLIALNDTLFAITAGHQALGQRPPGKSNRFSIQEREYDIDIESALVFRETEGRSNPQGARGDEPPAPSQVRASGNINSEVTGSDWSLIPVQIPQKMLPNLVHIKRDDDHGSSIVVPVHMTDVSTTPRKCIVHVLGGVSGLRKLTMKPTTSYLRTAAGVLVRAWKATYGSNNPPLVKGDSGAWVFNAQSGDVCGHVMATTSQHVYVMPLIDVFKEIRGLTDIQPHLPRPFDRLAELSRLNYIHGNAALAEAYAREALKGTILAQSPHEESPRLLADFLNAFPLRREPVCQVLMRTGPQIEESFTQVFRDAGNGLMGDIDSALILLRDLQSYAEDYGLDFSERRNANQDIQQTSIPGALVSLLCVAPPWFGQGRRELKRVKTYDTI